MTITAQDVNGEVQQIKCDKVEFYEDFLAYFIGGLRIGSVPAENVVRVTQE